MLDLFQKSLKRIPRIEHSDRLDLAYDGMFFSHVPS